MQSNPEVPPALAQAHLNADATPDKISVSEAAIRGGAVILTLLQQAGELTALPYLSTAAGLALNLVQIAQAVKDNKDGFKGLVDDSTDLVAVFYRAYQGAKDQENWLKGEAIQRAANDLVQCLQSAQILGTKMNARGMIRRILYHPTDANTIQTYRQKLTTVTTQFQIAAGLDVHDVLNQILKQNDELHADVKRLLAVLTSTGDSLQTPEQKALANEQRARERFDGGPAIEQIIFDSPSNATFDKDIILHLGTEDLSPAVTKQVGVKGGSNMHIKGGFYGAGSTSLAMQIAANQHEIEKQKLEIERRKLSLEQKRQQS